MKPGLCKIEPDHRDYSLLHTFAAGLPDPEGLPPNFSIYDGRPIPNQNALDDRFSPAHRPLPMGCTAEDRTFSAGLEDNELYDPVDFYFATPPGTDGEGRDMRMAFSVAYNRGFKRPDGTIGAQRGPYFNVYGSGTIDDFTAAKIAVWLHQQFKIPVSVGSFWYFEYRQPSLTGSLPLPSFDTTRATLHDWIVTGWRTLPDGTEELECISWQGNDYGLSGLVYMSRPIFNASMQQPWTGSFIQPPQTGQPPITIGVQAYIDHFVYWFRHTFNV